MSQQHYTSSWTDEAMDDADTIYTTTTTHAWRTRAKTDDDVLRQARLAEIINRVLSEALETRRPHHPSRICPTAAHYGAHIFIGSLYLYF